MSLMHKNKYEGEIFKTNSCGTLIVTSYINYAEVHVKFIDTGYETSAEMGQIKSGRVRDRLLPNLFGVGILEDEPTKVNGKNLKEYELWSNILLRCYSKTYHKKHPTYSDCTVSENFKHYPYFKEWCYKQVGFGTKGWDVDKDILVKGNKIYSENTCCFVPNEVNKLFTKNNSVRGDCPIGVNFHKTNQKYETKMTTGGKSLHLGVFNTELEAFFAYKQVKEAYIKEVAEKWKDDIDPRVYNALMNYQVEITD